MPYIGGMGAYRKACDDVAANGYRGFSTSPDHALDRAAVPA
jgi:hypothetical protein